MEYILCCFKKKVKKNTETSDEVLYDQWEKDFNKYIGLTKTTTKFYSSIPKIDSSNKL